jgi:hypothetical protein
MMGIQRPFRRTCRQFTDNSYARSGKSVYIEHEKYAESPEHYIRAFLLIQKDLHTLFDYIEPADKNLKTYSYRIHELLLRTCVEVEANCKAILLENGYVKNKDMNMTDYKRVNLSHRLSSYEVKLPLWSGKKNIRKPFLKWKDKKTLPWYDTYNQTKHDRHSKFELATFDHLIDSVCGLVALLSSQFWTYSFSGGNSNLISGSKDGKESAIGGYFRIKFPTDWKASEKYDFTYQDWESLKKSTVDPFQNFPYK